MKRKTKKIIIALILAIISFNLIYIPIKADSGWDSDYDYDYGSSDWGSDYDYDYDSGWGSSSYSSGSYSGDPDWIFIFTTVIMIIIIFYYISNNNNRNRPSSGRRSSTTKLNNYQDIDTTKIVAVDPTLNASEFKSKAFTIYKDIQTAWMNFDTETIRKLTTDEIYNMYSSQLETLKLKKQKNIMKDITLLESKIIDIKKENDVITTSVYLKVKCYDYVIKEATNEVVRGKNNQKIVIEYILSFVKSATNNNNEEKCPNCGAPVEINSSATCPYCDSTLVKNSSDYVMSKKTCIGQSLDR